MDGYLIKRAELESAEHNLLKNIGIKELEKASLLTNVSRRQVLDNEIADLNQRLLRVRTKIKDLKKDQAEKAA